MVALGWKPSVVVQKTRFRWQTYSEKPRFQHQFWMPWHFSALVPKVLASLAISKGCCYKGLPFQKSARACLGYQVGNTHIRCFLIMSFCWHCSARSCLKKSVFFSRFSPDWARSCWRKPLGMISGEVVTSCHDAMSSSIVLWGVTSY